MTLSCSSELYQSMYISLICIVYIEYFRYELYESVKDIIENLYKNNAN